MKFWIAISIVLSAQMMATSAFAREAKSKLGWPEFLGGPKQECLSHIEVDSSNRELGYAKVSCKKEQNALTVVTSETAVLCHNYSLIETKEATQCEFKRDPTLPLDIYSVVRIGQDIYTKQQHIYKDPTFNYPVEAEYVKTPSDITASEQEIDLATGDMLRGFKFVANISVKVHDQDILDYDPQQEIRVALVNAKTNSIISKTQLISTGETATFELEALFEIPRWVGKKGWRQDRHLKGGVNTFYVIVYDAYSQPAENNYIKLDTITINVRDVKHPTGK
jgi:hypothetical protein